MLDYNFTQRERQIIIRLIELSQHTKEHFEARIVDPAGGTGPSRELARLVFGTNARCMGNSFFLFFHSAREKGTARC